MRAAPTYIIPMPESRFEPHPVIKGAEDAFADAIPHLEKGRRPDFLPGDQRAHAADGARLVEVGANLLGQLRASELDDFTAKVAGRAADAVAMTSDQAYSFQDDATMLLGDAHQALAHIDSLKWSGRFNGPERTDLDTSWNTPGLPYL